MPKPSNSRERYLERASNLYHDQFRSRGNVANSAVKSGRRYLDEHGIPAQDQGRIVDAYRLGVVVSPLPGDERFAGMLAIPYLTPRGVKAIKFRRLDEGKPKYAAPKNQPVRLYNTLAYFAALAIGPKIGISEGEIDAVVATEILGVPTIGVPGAENWVKYGTVWTPLFKNFQEVLIFKDGDPEQERERNGVKIKVRPGDELADAICESLKTKARVIDCPEREDISSMVAAGRAAEITRQYEENDEEAKELTGDPMVDDPPPF